ncbi:Vesicle trafficking between the ER and Golgi [Chytriomyces hyalinus]|nr:Vesicle trafficking between the ER and Golgi [Chytriomyces hyalinus]KAJ3265524.1 Vesicle trafficking between the ER and Golgi [Chytriomyces hyalinus]KAJ3408976.1 Vesicle trafficking between the ER and Golgi [Chytriomyces hyalinus]
MSLRQAQKDAVAVMLNLNSSVANAETVWKVLVYDKAGQDIISQLLKVNELRENGVTVHMPLFTDRQPIPDVPGVYFVQPTSESIRRIGEDLAKNLYESYYLNFTYTISRNLLEELAAAAVAANASVQIAQVYDQYLNYISLEERLFSLNFSNTYKVLNDATSTDRTIDAVTESIVSSLFSVVATMGVVPIIRCPRGNAAAGVAQKLDQRIREHIMNSRNNNLFSEPSASSSSPSSMASSLSSNSSARPVLILLDRNVDLASMLAHTWTYSTLVHDLLDLNLNRVNIETEDKGRKVKKTFDIDAHDFFWVKNSGNPFPQVADDVNSEITRYKKDVEDVTKTSGVTSLNDMDPNSNAEVLKYALTALPELTDRKRTLDMHMNIATALFGIINERKLDTFFAQEEAVGKLTKPAVLETLKDAEKSAQDKLRFFLVYFLSHDDITKEDLAAYEEALVAAGASVAPLNYLKGVKSFIKMAAAASTAGGSGAQSNVTSGSSDLFGKFTSKLAGTLEGAGVSGGFENLISGVRNLLPTRKDLPSTRIVEAIMEGNTAGTDAEEYLQLDPKASRALAAGKSATKPTLSSTNKGYQNAIVFVVGGGNYLEYQNLQDYAQRSQQKKKVTYGSTEILTANAFIAQLEALGSR